ncbi:hypothetical protein LPJ66_001911 [Kickxella alabastrina]|uniref:Uncharacterized protein n=1 Tax=Kickxella alabastrina TaxID=61397 RepID=A0ACC1IRY4_9FUNG|nr:hypothetical protein LPJ66_001911 [Kickxella alabastrina]
MILPNITFMAAFAAVGTLGTMSSTVSSRAEFSPNTGHNPSKSILGNTNAHQTPFVIPSLQEWDGGNGVWVINKVTRIVVDSEYANGIALDFKHSFMANPSHLQEFATSFQSDIKQVTGIEIDVVVSNKYSKDDIFMTLGAEIKDPKLNNEGYHLSISQMGVVIQAVTSRGAFWGTRTLLQMLILADKSGFALPQGHTRDYPNYNERKFVQDIARKPIPMSDLKEYAILTSFYKYNMHHLHFNDNAGMRTKGLMPDWRAKYSGFRLKSDNPAFSVYASSDTAYTKQDMRDYQNFIKARGLDLIPEIDTPAHSLCFTRFHPEWSIQEDTARGDWLDLENKDVWSFVETLWAEFIGWFDSREISIGADEYDESKGDLARKFVNHCHRYFATHFNRTIRMWGSDVKLPGTVEINKSIHTDHWDFTYSNPVDLVKRGHRVCNLNAPDVYLVPRSHTYSDYFDQQKLYELWEPWVFDILNRTNTSRNLSPTEPLLTGGGFANWNDFLGESVTRVELYDRVSQAAGVVSEKMWTGSKNTDRMAYDDWAPLAKKLRESIPGITLTHRPKSKSSFVIIYDFEDGAAEDTSGNGYDGKLSSSARIVDAGEGHGKAAQLSVNSYITTPLKSIRYPYTIGMWVKPSGMQPHNAVLLESGDGKLLISNSTAHTVTFEQDSNHYATQIILPPDTWSHIAFSADEDRTSVFFNMRRRAIVKYFNPRWDQMCNETIVVTGPISSIGSRSGSSFSGLVNSFFVLNRAINASELAFLAKRYANALP